MIKTKKFEFEVSALHFNFIEKIQELMNERSIKNKEFAKKLKVPESFVSQLFSGDKLLDLKLLTQIQKIFDVRYITKPYPKLSEQDLKENWKKIVMATAFK